MSTSFDELLTKARSAPKPHKDVDVSLDQAVSGQVADIDQQITDLNIELERLNADKRLADPRPGEIESQIEKLGEQREALTDGTLVTLRFTQMKGQDWAELGAHSPARPDVILDRMYGYNYQRVATHAAVASGGRLLDDGTVESLTEEQWAGLWEVLSGHEFERIASTLFELNDYGPQQRVAAAGKASRAGSDSKSN